MNSLTGFLLARIAEDEALARESAYAPPPFGDLGSMSTADETSYGDLYLAVNPTRILAECVAKRAIVDLHDEPHDCLPWGRAPMEPCSTLTALAAVYADRRDYRSEWRP